MWHQHSLRHTRKSTQPLTAPCRGWVNPDVLYTSHRRLYVHPKRFRFTNQLIKSLPPNTSDARSTDAEYSDTEISGLKCLVSRREGRKKFLLRYLYHGRKRAIAIGHWPEVDVNLARQIAIEHKRSLATGTDPKQERENKENGADVR
ncbi:hypothetical protein CSC04_0031 [Enterobacter roggenkampii]|uniref:Arm DNA-binding domain-containing protein n=1 Tax=Enterobacter roggenkampii TaxID=1812935 RepID=UPI000D4FCE94|nr:Arm DNA-binding domain-containing protein [Enterobacter roggenkampii]PRW39420.1 hypothetical protein CSC04_0031 [Enterobacter roggenkampii]